MKKPGFFTGALISFFSGITLVVIFLLGWKIAGFSFVPFDLFDWTTRILPGAVITFSIESMVKLIRFFNLGSTAVAAKAAEQLIAVINFLIVSIVAGTIILSILRKKRKTRYIIGIIAGIVFGLLILLVDLDLDRFTITDEIWNLLVFIGWGSILVWVNSRMMILSGRDSKETAFVERIDRRRFIIQLGTLTAAIAVTGAVVELLTGKKQRPSPVIERWSAHNDLPNANAPVKPAPGTRPELTPVENHYRIDIDAMPPVINEGNWRLKISGLVEDPLELSLQEIQSYDKTDQFITLSCISNPVGGDLISTTRWTGVSMQKILPRLKLKKDATCLLINSADGFFESVPIDLIKNDSRIMLAYEWDGIPLTAAHGFPLRIYIPDRYGMKQPKWIESIVAMDECAIGYWVERGWDQEAKMKATSVIDTIDVKNTITIQGGGKLVPVGGIAHAGSRGISKVEVRIDNGEWAETQLRTPLSDLTWVIWRYDMPFHEGKHTLTVRCYDGNGTPQIITPAPPHPSGASGLDTRKYKI